jgi:hypothetical protein
MYQSREPRGAVPPSPVHGVIYKHAFSVIAWLGLKSPGVEHAFEFAACIARRRNDMYNEASAGADAFGRDPWNYPEVYGKMLAVFNSDPVAANHLTQLFDRDYFERVWCIQEVVASKKCLAKCEDLEMDIFKLLFTATYVEGQRRITFPLKTLQFWNAVFQKRLRSMVSTRRWDIDGSIGKLLALLMGIREFKATDQRDKIYGLLGISDEGLESVMALTQALGTDDHPALNLLRRVGIWVANKARDLGPDFDPMRNAALKPN